MSLPETCPFCGSGVDFRNAEEWVGFTCITMINAGHDARRLQSVTCAGLERQRLAARVAELEAREKQAREDEAWAEDNGVVIDAEPVEKGWCAMLVREDGPLIEVPSAKGPTIHTAIRAMREKVEGGAR